MRGMDAPEEPAAVVPQNGLLRAFAQCEEGIHEPEFVRVRQGSALDEAFPSVQRSLMRGVD